MFRLYQGLQVQISNLLDIICPIKSLAQNAEVWVLVHLGQLYAILD